MREKITASTLDVNLDEQRLIEAFEMMVEDMRAGIRSNSSFTSIITNPDAEPTDNNYIDYSRLGVLISHINLSPDEILEAWMKTLQTFDSRLSKGEVYQRNAYIVHNYLMLMSVEISYPGGAKILHDEFGIKDYFRYNLRALLDQLANRDNREDPYGVVILPRDDHNGAFYQLKQQLEAIREVLMDEGYLLRIYEVEGRLDLVRRLFIAQERYGKDGENGHKISFGILGGHGLGTNIQLDEENELTTLDTYFMGERLRARMGDIFEMDAPLVLASCASGEDGGIAQELSDLLNVRVIAPESSCHMEKCEIEINNAHTIEFDVAYKMDDSVVNAKKYVPGESRQSVHLDLTYERAPMLYPQGYKPRVFDDVIG
jgi:hypothetical protein